MMKTAPILFAGTCVLALASVAHAESAAALELATSTDIIVTALRVPTPTADTGVQVSVLDNAALANRQTASIAELLATLPGSPMTGRAAWARCPLSASEAQKAARPLCCSTACG
jgi:outer membrane receptor protein involved in Fe transport